MNQRYSPQTVGARSYDANITITFPLPGRQPFPIPSPFKVMGYYNPTAVRIVSARIVTAEATPQDVTVLNIVTNPNANPATWEANFTTNDPAFTPRIGTEMALIVTAVNVTGDTLTRIVPFRYTVQPVNLGFNTNGAFATITGNALGATELAVTSDYPYAVGTLNAVTGDFSISEISLNNFNLNVQFRDQSVGDPAIACHFVKDETPPVVATRPSIIHASDSIDITYIEAMGPGAFLAASYTLTNSDGGVAIASVDPSGGNTIASIHPTNPLNPNKNPHHLKIIVGSVKDLAGNILDATADTDFDFTVVAD